jgi:hypothetical protein
MRRIACALACTILAGTPARAQVNLALGGGVSFPQGPLAGGTGTGWNALASLTISGLMQPLGFRADVAYDRFPASGTGTGYSAVGSATANITYRLPSAGSPFAPYLIAGLGAYRAECSPGCGTRTRFGGNVGLGTKFRVLPLAMFAEVRYHRAGAHFFPITLGFIF